MVSSGWLWLIVAGLAKGLVLDQKGSAIASMVVDSQGQHEPLAVLKWGAAQAVSFYQKAKCKTWFLFVDSQELQQVCACLFGYLFFQLCPSCGSVSGEPPCSAGPIGCHTLQCVCVCCFVHLHFDRFCICKNPCIFAHVCSRTHLKV